MTPNQERLKENKKASGLKPMGGAGRLPQEEVSDLHKRSFVFIGTIKTKEVKCKAEKEDAENQRLTSSRMTRKRTAA